MGNFKAYIFIILTFILIFTACSSDEPLVPGVYEGSARGFNAESSIKISVTVDKDENVSDVIILSHEETPSIGGVALEKLVKDIEEKNVEDIDVISGATRTSEGFIKALEDALSKAKE